MLPKRLIPVCLLVSIAAQVGGALARGQSPNQPAPQFEQIEKLVLNYFRKNKDYRPGDFITREDARPLLEQLQKQGLPAADAQKLIAQMVASGEFLAVQFKTPKGKAFMRRVSCYQDGFDRLDRLSRLPRGEQTVRDLIRGPGGEKLVQYMTETKGGEELGNQLSNIPNTPDFNSPTGRIYTVEQLLERLQASYPQPPKKPQNSPKR